MSEQPMHNTRPLEKSMYILWFLMIALLPITSMPAVVRLVKSDTVAAPAGLVLLVLVLLSLLPSVFSGKPFPRQVIPLLVFFMLAILSTLLSAYIIVPPFKEVNVMMERLQAVITLAIGVCFYLVAATFPNDKSLLSKTVRWINWSGLVVLLWSLIQAAAWFQFHVYPVWMEIIQRTLSTGVLYKARVSGFALEPSWLAHQLNMLYLPLWLACTVKRWSAHHRILGVISFENILLLCGLLVMGLTFSRVGLLAIGLMVAYLVFQATLRISRWVQNKFFDSLGDRRSILQQKAIKFFFTAFIFILLVIIYAAMLLLLAYAFRKFDPRMSEVFQFTVYENNTLLRYANRIDFAPRVVYWLAGWDIFNEFPWLGVGLGNAGFFFPQKITPYGWNFMEVGEMMYRSSNLTNIKNLWFRLLAETGVAGFSLFISWLFTIWKSGKQLSGQSDGLYSSLGLAGIFVVLGLFVEGFSVDSFALPYYWMTFGLTTSAFQIMKTGTACAEIKTA